MLLCFATGAAAMPAMVGLSVLMAVERLTRWGRRVVRPAGVGLAMAGVAVWAGIVPAPVLHVLVGG